MAINCSHRGFALLIAVIFTSVMLAFALTLGSLAYKQQILASVANQSQYAFYAADAGLECALRYDQPSTGSLFEYKSGYTNPPPGFECDGDQPIAPSAGDVEDTIMQGTPVMILKYKFDLDNNTRCVEITMHKYQMIPASTFPTYIFSQGYDVGCTSVGSATRYASRGLQAHY